jgi:signal transduction histidine kinase
MNISPFTSIRTKASLLFFILFVGIILPVNWIIYTKIKSVLEEASRREMAWEAEKLLDQVKLDPLIVPLPGKYDIQLEFEGELHDEVIFSSPGFPSLLVDNHTVDYYRIDTLEVIHLSRQAPSSRGVLVLSLVRSNAALTQQLADVQLYLFVASSISLLVAAILVYLAAGWMLRPIHRISQAASRIQAAESIERVPVPHTRDESRTLAEALNAMLERIEHTIKNQTNFFASATHELKTPLAIMKAGLSGTDAKDDPKLKGFLTEVERLDRVISDFLIISQLKSDSLIIRKKTESVEEIIYRALQKVTYLKEHRQSKIRVTLSGENKTYASLVDSDKIETVFINLFGNALKYSHPSSVDILLHETSDHLEVEISNPLKEPVADAPSLAGEFKKSRELSDGLGMGLWICEQILKLHDGSLTLKSEDLLFTAVVMLPK